LKINLLKHLYTIRKLSISQKLYLIALFLLGISAVLAVLYIIGMSTNPMPVLVLSSFVAMFGLVAELTSIYKKLWSTMLGKPILALLALAITNMTIGLSFQVVNVVTTAPPEKFTLTVSTLTILLIPLVIALIVGLGYLIIVLFITLCLPFYAIYWLFKRDLVNKPCLIYFRYFFRSKEKQYKKTTLLGRTYAVIITAAIGKAMLGVAPDYEKKVLKSFVGWHAHTFEMYEYGSCMNPEYEKQLSLTKSTVLFSRAKTKGFQFKVLPCQALTNASS
jgi:hypothetical protein